MSAGRRNRYRGVVVTILVLVPLIAYVVWSSFRLSDYECEVCMSFEGRQSCRTVAGKTEQEGVRTGIDNACANLTSGVTNTLRCTRQQPTRAECRPL